MSLTNSGRHAREIELTSYAELVLTTPATDDAHPAFAKMFVETEYVAEFGALVATRRPRSRDEAQVWAAHFAVVEGEILADPQYESDRVALHRPWPHHRNGRGDRRRPTAHEHGRDRPRPDLFAAAPGEGSARAGRPGRLLDRRCIVSCRIAGSRRPAQRSQRLRAGEDPRLDAGPGATAPSRHRGEGGGGLPASGGADPLLRPALPGILGSHRPRGGAPIGPVAARHIR